MVKEQCLIELKFTDLNFLVQYQGITLTNTQCTLACGTPQPTLCCRCSSLHKSWHAFPEWYNGFPIHSTSE